MLKNVLPLAGLICTAAAADAVGGGITGVSWGPQRVDLFGLDSKNDVFHKYFTAFGWGPDDPAHGNLEVHGKANASSAVSVASWGPNRLDFVFVDSNGTAKHQYWESSEWGPNGQDGYETLGGNVTGKLAIMSWGPDRFDVVGLSDDSSYVHKAWTGKEYYPPKGWLDLGGKFNSTPALTSWGPGRLDVIGIDFQGNLLHKYWDGYEWQPRHGFWEDLSGRGLVFSGRPYASSMAKNRFDVWAICNKTGELYHTFWDGKGYFPWESLGGNFTDAPQVVHWAPGRIDILGKDAGENGTYKYKYWDGYQWKGWYDKGSDFASEPALVNIGENNLNLVGIDNEGKLKLQVWDGSQWLPSEDTWFELGDTTATGGTSVFNGLVNNVGERVLGFDEERVRIELRFKA